ncbi:MAG: GEVED domain-containing protein, partial [Vicingaceae bacterium]
MKKITMLISALVLTAFGWQANAQYCTTGPSNGADSNVETVDITGDVATSINYAGCTGGAGVIGLDDQTALSVDVTAGSPYTADIQFGTCGGNYLSAGEAWIDWNQNDVFDAGESIGSVTGTPPLTLSSFSFTVPAGAFNGATRMRVTQIEGGTLPLNPCATFNYGSAMDFTINVSGGVTLSCSAPSALSATNIASTSADLAWIENGSATDWQIEWGITGFIPGAGTLVVTTTNPHNLTALAANTSYDFYVRAICGAADSSSWSGPYSFATVCSPLIAPWSEDFDVATAIPSCWNQGAGNSEDWIFSSTGGHVGNAGTIGGTTTSGNNFAYVDDSSPDNTGTTLETPLIDVSGLTTPALSFFLISNNEGNSNVTFSVDVYDGAAWNAAFYTSSANTVNGEWEKIVLDLSSLTITGPI